jgi:small basic protein (TIGR04137 family)
MEYKRRPPFRSDAGKPFTKYTDMSKHSTLKATGTVGGKRSVLKRFERVKLMKERGQWKQGQSPIGLPKTKFEA